jgi:hypothetical protein
MNQHPVNEQITYRCEKCDYTTLLKGDYKRHLLSKKHNAAEDTEHRCEHCNYSTTSLKYYKSHLESVKHAKNVVMHKNNLSPNQCEFCKKLLSSKRSLWRHKQTCNATVEKNVDNDDDSSDIEEENENDPSTTPPPSPAANAITPELLFNFMKQTMDLQKIMIENQNMTNSHNTNHSHNNTVNNNQTFNLQFFLNEHCKDAIDIQEFVNTLNYSTENLEKNMKLGYTKGISKMFTDGISILPAEKRPMHCSDEKREKLYIRHNGTWISGNDSKERLTQVIADIANKNYDTFRNWVFENPGCQTMDTPAYEKFMTIYQGVIGSRSDEEEVKDVKKILSNIMDQIVIDKEKYLQ